MRRLERRRVIHAVAGHGHDLAVGFESGHQTELLFRHDTGEYVDVLMRRLSSSLLSASSSGPVITFSGGLEPDLPGNVPRRPGIVAGDHDHSDAGPVTILQRRCHRRTDRIDEAYQPEKLEVKIVLYSRETRLTEVGAGDTQDAQSLVSHLGHRRHQLGQLFCAEMAEVGDRLRGAFGRNDVVAPLQRPPDMGHGKKLRRERVFPLQGASRRGDARYGPGTLRRTP